MKAEILKKIYEENKQGRDGALAFLMENRGSTPGEDNSVMAVFADGSSMGTIGGGAIEADVIRRCRENMKAGTSFEFDYNLSKNGELKMACGGNSRGYVQYFKARKRLIIFGAGHVSQKLARIATRTGFAVDVIDDRADFQDSPDFVGIDTYSTLPVEEAAANLPFDADQTFIVLCTRGHAHDKEALRALVGKECAYLGMIGSKAKVATVFQELREEGVAKEALDKVYAPIGLDLDNGSVEEIAISILSQMLMVKNGKDGRSLREKREREEDHHSKR